MMKKLMVSALLMSLTLIACKSKEKAAATAPAVETTAAPSATATVTFLKDIKPIMDAYCTRCHNTNEKAGYNFEELSFVKKAASNGYLLGTIKHTEGFAGMPAYAAPLDNATIAKIESWINSGMN